MPTTAPSYLQIKSDQQIDNSRRNKARLSLLVSAIDYCAHDETMKDENDRSFGNQQMSGDGPRAGIPAITIAFGSVASSVHRGTV